MLLGKIFHHQTYDFHYNRLILYSPVKLGECRQTLPAYLLTGRVEILAISLFIC